MSPPPPVTIAFMTVLIRSQTRRRPQARAAALLTSRLLSSGHRVWPPDPRSIEGGSQPKPRHTPAYRQKRNGRDVRPAVRTGRERTGRDRRAHGHTRWADKDGIRAQLRYDGRSVSLRTRHGRECSADFPELADIADALGKHRVTLDGELVCPRPDGRPDFARPRRRLTGAARPRHAVTLQIFDGLSRDFADTAKSAAAASRCQFLVQDRALAPFLGSW
jgi:hypothetical protein